MGIIIGSIIGFKFGGWFGMLMGAWLGHVIEEKVTGQKRLGGKKQTQESFFNALFITMGRLSKLDGQVSPSEIKRAEGIMAHMKLNHEMRQRAIELFNQGKDINFNIDPSLSTFGNCSKRSLSLKQIFLEMLIDVAEADGMITREEERLIEHTCRMIGYPVRLLHAMIKLRGFAANAGYQKDRRNQRNNQHQSRSGSNRNAPFNPYHVLGVDQADGKQTIRRAYKKLMSQHHPDKLVSKGLPPEMMKVAEEKAKQVQLAWEKVKELKGW